MNREERRRMARQVVTAEGVGSRRKLNKMRSAVAKTLGQVELKEKKEETDEAEAEAE